MDLIKISKVEDVVMEKGNQGTANKGTIYLTTHHLIFSCPNFELWIIYANIQTLDKKPAAVPGSAITISIRCRDLLVVKFRMTNEYLAGQLFESLQNLTYANSLERFYAVSFQPKQPYKEDGWKLFDIKAEYARMGVETKTSKWKFSYANRNYAICPTYPEIIVVPATAGDSLLMEVAKFRSKGRLPVLSYLHPANMGSITRGSQPMSGIHKLSGFNDKRCISDERLLEAIFATSDSVNGPDSSSSSFVTHTRYIADTDDMSPPGGIPRGLSNAAGRASQFGREYGTKRTSPQLYASALGSSPNSSLSSINANANSLPPSQTTASTASSANPFISSSSSPSSFSSFAASPASPSSAQSTDGNSNSINIIMDARPKFNAMANMALGGGYENTEYYRNSKLMFMNIENIHTMRDSQRKLTEAVESLEVDYEKWQHQLDSSGWLKHLRCVLESAVCTTKTVGIQGGHVFVHCSDGWDRTSQITSLAAMMMDPFARTIRGFEIVVEREWLSFGHKFTERCGHLAKNPKGSVNSPKEISPVFLQFLECAALIRRQFPAEFEFNERLLVDLYSHLYSCQFGTFMFNCERERSTFGAKERTYSVWSAIHASERDYINPLYRPGSMCDASGILIPSYRYQDLRLWASLFCRWEDDMRIKDPSGTFIKRAEDTLERARLEQALAKAMARRERAQTAIYVRKLRRFEILRSYGRNSMSSGGAGAHGHMSAPAADHRNSAPTAIQSMTASAMCEGGSEASSSSKASAEPAAAADEEEAQANTGIVPEGTKVSSASGSAESGHEAADRDGPAVVAGAIAGGSGDEGGSGNDVSGDALIQGGNAGDTVESVGGEAAVISPSAEDTGSESEAANVMRGIASAASMASDSATVPVSQQESFGGGSNGNLGDESFFSILNELDGDDLLMEAQEEPILHEMTRAVLPKLGEWKPVWSSPVCGLCHCLFESDLHKRKCPVCGAVICSGCSLCTYRVPLVDETPFRVCDTCFSAHAN